MQPTVSSGSAVGRINGVCKGRDKPPAFMRGFMTPKNTPAPFCSMRSLLFCGTSKANENSNERNEV